MHTPTGKQAETLGISDRAVLAPGKEAEISIFDIGELYYGPQLERSQPARRSTSTAA